MYHLDLKEVQRDWAGEYRFWQTTNHANPARAGEIIQDFDLGIYVAQIVDLTDNCELVDDLGNFSTLKDALRALECECPFKVSIGKIIASSDIQYAG